ncbi:MAG: hypothetical protein PHS14_10685, partial [Elusimicrobia bacterium]|nr:hypothetical protein [Elusimicrobiota bacterium]
MRNPSSPLRRALAVIVSLLILPWQQPALALAESPAAGAVVLGVSLDKPREALDALDRRLAVLLERVKSDDLKTPELTAALPEDLAKLKAEYKAAQDAYAAAEKEAPDAAKPELKALSAASTGQMIVEAVVEADLGGVRKDLSALLVSEASLSRRPDQIPEADWAAVEKAAPDFSAGLRPLSSRVEKARNQPRYDAKDVEDAYRPLAAALDASFQNLRGRASKLDLDGLLAAKPKTVSGDAAGALMAEVARSLPADKAALLKPQLAAVNAKLAGYLRSGNPADLTSALGEIDRLYDAAQIKDKDKRAELFERIGQAAQARAQAGPAAAIGGQESVLTSNGVKPNSDMASMRHLDAVPLTVADTAATRAGLGDALAAWVKSGRAAAGPARDALRKLMPESADPAAFVRDYALRGLSDLSLGRAAALKNENSSEKAAKALADAYARIEAEVVAVVLGAPDRGLDPAPADGKARAAYDRKWETNSAEQLKKLKEVEAELAVAVKTELGVSGPGVWGWSEAVFAKTPALVTEAEAKALAPARARAKTLVDLIGSLREQHEKGTLDLTTFEDKDRRHILYADGQGSVAGLGAIGQAVVSRTATERESAAKAEAVLAAFKAVPLTGNPAADAAALDAFFDAAGPKAAAAAGDLPPMLADWARARAFEKENARLKAEGKAPLPRPSGLPRTDEAYGRVLVADRYGRIKAIGDLTEKQMGELHESYFAMNRAAYAALGCDPAKLAAAESQSEGALPAATGADRTIAAEPESPPVEEAAPGKLDPKKTAAFCEGFLKNARRPSSYDRLQFDAQKKLADQIRPFLNDNDLSRASAKSGQATAEMLRDMREMSPELRAELGRRGVDVDGILKQNDRGQVLQWAAVVRQLNTAGDDAGWSAFRDGLIGRFYGDRTAQATKVSADALRKAASSSDAAGLAAALGGMQNPALLTGGYLSALPKMLASERSPRSSRDRALLFMWNGGVKTGEAPPEKTYAGLLLSSADRYDEAAAKPENKEGAEELKRLSALMRAVAADPSDPEKTAEALRAAGQPVFDARAVRVGLDAAKVPAYPKTEEERRDFLAARSLARLFLAEGESFRTPAGAEKIRRGLLAKLGGEIADAQEQNRRDQLILSASDEYQDRVAKLGRVSTEMLGEGGAGAARRRVEGGASYRELLGLSGSVKSYQDASLALYDVTEKLSATAWGRASLTLPGLLASAKARSLAALQGNAAPDGLTLSGWMVGIAAGDVTLRRGYRTAGAADQPALPVGQQAIVDMAGRPDAPKGPPKTRTLDGIAFRGEDGAAVFRTLDGGYSETRSRKVETVTVDGKKMSAAVSMGVNSAGERIQVYTAGGKSFVLETKGSYDAKGAVRSTVTRRPVAGVSGIAPVETIQIVSGENGRQAVSLIERRASGSGETLNWTRFYSPKTKGAAYDSVSMDLVGHTRSVTTGGRRTTFDLAKNNAELDASRRRSTYDVSGGASRLVRTEYYSISKDADGARVVKAVVEKPRTDLSRPGEATVVEIRDYRLRADAGDDTRRDGFGKPVYRNSISRLGAAELDRAIVGRQLVADGREDDRGAPRVDFRVTLNRDGKTNAELAASYRAIGRRIGGEMSLHKDDGGKTPLAGEFSERFEKLARFFDNQFVTADAAYAVTASISRGGAVSMSGMRFDGAKMRDASVDSPQYAFIALPKDAPKRQPGLPDKEQNGIFLQQELAGVRRAAGDEYAFVTIAPGAGGRDQVTGFFGNYQGAEKNHSFRMDAFDKKKTDGNGHWYYAADIVRNYFVDGASAGKIVADESTSVWNGGSKLGAYTSNSIRYTDWGRRNPKTAAFVGGVAGGAIMTLLDPVMLGMMVIPMGAGYVA